MGVRAPSYYHSISPNCIDGQTTEGREGGVSGSDDIIVVRSIAHIDFEPNSIIENLAIVCIADQVYRLKLPEEERVGDSK